MRYVSKVIQKILIHIPAYRRYHIRKIHERLTQLALNYNGRLVSQEDIDTVANNRIPIVNVLNEKFGDRNA